MVCGTKPRSLVACREMPGYFPSERSFTYDTRLYRRPGAQVWVGSSQNWSELIGLPGKTLTRDATRMIRFVVHAAAWLRPMVFNGRTVVVVVGQATEPAA